MTLYKQERTLPLYTATKSLDVRYIFNDDLENAKITLYGAHNHAKLYAAYTGILNKRKELEYKPDISNINFAMAKITVLYTDTNSEEGMLGDDIEKATLDISVSQNDRILSCSNLYSHSFRLDNIAKNKALRCHEFNQTLFDRIDSFGYIADDYYTNSNTCVSYRRFDQEVENPRFHEKFHHSEQGFMHFISTPIGVDTLTNFARRQGAKYIYGLVCDVYSSHSLCSNCNVSFLGLQNSHETGFLFDFNKSLQRKRMEPRANGNTFFSTRASVSHPCQGQQMNVFELPDDGRTVHRYNPDQKNHIFQAKNSALGRAKLIRENGYSLSDFEGSFFVSKTFDKVGVESAISLTR